MESTNLLEMEMPISQSIREDFLVFGSPAIGEEEIEEVVETLRSGWLGTGPKVKRFETEFANYIGTRHALALNSATAGLFLALDVAGIGEADEVITTPMTFAATANVIVHRRARPVFVDVERDTQNIDPNRIEDAITSRTRAIMPVHMAGRPCEMDAIMDIAERHNLVVIEDAAHAIESVYRNQKIGNIGHFGVFSFYVTKNLCTGEGGMVTTNVDSWAEELRMKSLHGLSKDAWKRYSSEGFQPYETVYPGYKFNMMDIQAALGIHQLARIENYLSLREKYWKMYDEAFASFPEIITPSPRLPEASRHARHLYTMLVDLDSLTITRNEFIERLMEEKIGTGVHFTALHLHKYYRDTFGYKTGDYPNAEWIGERTISLPLSARLLRSDVESVIAAVTKVITQNRKVAYAN